MASNKVAGVLSTEIQLDTTKASKSLRQLNTDISSTVSILKQQEQEFKSTGDNVNELKTRISRLQETQDGYYEKLKVLKQAQNDVKERLGESSTEYQKYQTQINKTITTISRYDDQISKAKKSLEYYNSGLADLKQSYSEQQRYSTSLVNKLKAEGNTYQANAAEIKSLKTSLSNLKQQYDIQERELDSIAEKSGKASSAYRTQATRLNETATSIAKTQSKLKGMNTSFTSSNETIAKVRDKMSLFNKSTDEGTSKIGRFTSGIKNTALGVGIANTAMTALNAVAGQVGDAVSRVDTLANSKRVFQNMGYSAKDTNTAMDGLNKSIQGLPTGLDQAVSGVQMVASTTNNLKQAQQVWSALNDGIIGFGGSTEQVETAVQQLSQAFSNGKIDAQTWNSMMDAQLGPTLNAIAKDMGVTTAQLKDGLSKGTISVKQFQDELIKLDTQGGGGLKSLSKIAHDSTSGISTAFTNMKTAVTRGLGNMITNFSDALGKVTGSNLSQTITKFGSVAEKMLSNLGTSIGKIVPIIKEWTPVFNAVKNVIKSAFEGFSPIIDEFKKQLDSSSKKGTSFKGTIQAISAVLNALAPIVKLIANVISNSFLIALKLVTGAIDLVVKGVKGIISLNEKTTKFFKDAGESAYKFAKNLKEDVSDACDKAKKWMSDSWKNMKKTVSDSVTAMTDKNSKLHDEMISKISDATGVSKKTLNSAYDTMADSTQTWKDLLSGKWDRLGGDLKKVGKDISKTAKSAFQDMYDKLNEKTHGGLDKIKNKWDGMWSDLKDKASKGAKNVGNGAVSMVNNVIKSINSMIKGVQKGINWVLDKFGADKVKFGTIETVPKFAKGGIVGGGTMALVNDAPGSNYREMFATPDGKIGMFPKERNFMTYLPKGTQVLDGERSKALADMMNIPQFKDGTDNKNIFEKMFDKAWDIAKEVGNVIAHPIKFLENSFGKYITPSDSDKGWAKTVITKAPSYFAKQGGNWIKKIAEDWKKKKEESSVAGVDAKNIGSGAKNWTDTIKKVAKAMKVELSESDINLILWRINKESGGNQSIKQQVWDINMANGNPAQGLLQYVPSTFASWMVSGHNNILSGEDQLYAMFNDSNWRKDIANSGGWGPTGTRRFANGGFVNGFTQAIVGEAGPEVIIPLSANKQGRALDLLTRTVNKLNRNAGTNTVVTSDNGSLEGKLDQMISLLGQLVGINANGFNKQSSNSNGLDALYQKMYQDQQLNNYQSF